MIIIIQKRARVDIHIQDISPVFGMEVHILKHQNGIMQDYAKIVILQYGIHTT